MSCRGRINGRSGRGSGCGGHGGRGHNYLGAGNGVGKKGLCPGRGTDVFDYVHKAAADQMRTSWEKLVQYVGTSYGSDISNELQNKTAVVLPEPVHELAVMVIHMAREVMFRAGQLNI